MIPENEVRKQICEIGRRIYNSGFVAANDGNISVRLGADEILTTPAGVSKGFMTPAMLCKVRMDGSLIGMKSKYVPSSELKMHLRVYEKRPDVKAVVHAHPPYATSYAVAGIPLDLPITAEAVMNLGYVPITEFALPSTEQVPDSIEKYLQIFDAMLLANHGALTYGEDLGSAWFKMETLELYAKTTFLSNQLGPRVLTPSQVESLYQLRRESGMSGKHPANSRE